MHMPDAIAVPRFRRQLAEHQFASGMQAPFNPTPTTHGLQLEQRAGVDAARVEFRQFRQEHDLRTGPGDA